MGTEALLRTLGLGPGASLDDVRRAYRALALRYHPDRRRDDPGAHERFIEIAKAYRRLIDLYSARTNAFAELRRCPACRGIDRLYPGVDGRDYCGDCLLGRARRLLPHPIVRIVRFQGVCGLLATAAVGAVRTYTHGGWAWPVVTLGSVAAAMLWLSAVTIRVSLTYDRRMPVSGR